VPTEPLTDRLRVAGLRVTATRMAVLSVLDASDDHPRVDQIIERVRGSGTTISTQATYDVCEALHGAGLIRRIEPGNHPARFESRIGDNHHHLVCRSCGFALDVDCAVGQVGCLTPSDARGFAVDEAEVTFWGQCPACQDTTEGKTHE
jgi:Fur family ferric uptake transcriptional regulator